MCLESGVCCCVVCALCSMRVMSGVRLCEMFAQWSVCAVCVVSGVGLC